VSSGVAPYILALIPSGAAFLGIVAAAWLATMGYRSQKNADREAERVQSKAETYRRFLKSYHEYIEFDVYKTRGDPKFDEAKYEKAEDEYLAAFSDMCFTAPSKVLEKVYEFHSVAFVPSGAIEQVEKRKRAYAAMLVEMRSDAFLTTDLNAGQMAELLPWTF
jgi:hypothetical protein